MSSFTQDNTMKIELLLHKIPQNQTASEMQSEPIFTIEGILIRNSRYIKKALFQGEKLPSK